MMKPLRITLLTIWLIAAYTASAQTLDSVYAYIKESGIRYPEVVMRQAILETGWLKSPYLMKRNNLFGFRHRKTYMRFSTWQASVDYYKEWQNKHYTREGEDYYKFLQRIKYAQSSVYIATLKKIKFP